MTRTPLARRTTLPDELAGPAIESVNGIGPGDDDRLTSHHRGEEQGNCLMVRKTRDLAETAADLLVELEK